MKRISPAECMKDFNRCRRNGRSSSSRAAGRKDLLLENLPPVAALEQEMVGMRMSAEVEGQDGREVEPMRMTNNPRRGVELMTMTNPAYPRREVVQMTTMQMCAGGREEGAGMDAESTMTTRTFAMIGAGGFSVTMTVVAAGLPMMTSRLLGARDAMMATDEIQWEGKV